ncbi:MAG TPA: hypothetical protein VID72_07480 [Ktedonobacterales bacterium]
MWLYRFGLLLTLAGNLLVIVAFFSPWFDVFKLNDPSFPFPKRGYSPWIVIQSGQLDALDVVTGMFFLLILGMALSSLALALTRTARRRAQATVIAGILAVVSLAMIVVVVPTISFDLSFSWPYLDSNFAYGAYLATVGFLSVLVGIATLANVRARQH